jgi:uncharacterized protein YgbK (DUF1537 family)
MTGALRRADVLAALPAPWPEPLRPAIQAAVGAGSGHKLVVLDDDPTGTQTVQDVPVLTVWDADALRAEFDAPGPCFYLLTNSRSLTAARAGALNREIARALRTAAAGRTFSVVSRSDSTLRGHFPVETDVLAEELGPFDATVLIPYFEAGGRWTINDIHYVAEGDMLVPAAETPFARDAVFGYRSSNLREYVAEKTGGRVPASGVLSIGLDDLRFGGPAAVVRKLGAARERVLIVNAAAPADLDVFVAALLDPALSEKRLLFRTAAQFVAARLGLEPKPLWRPRRGASSNGGLVIVGSYVPKTTDQLNRLLEIRAGRIDEIGIDVVSVLEGRFDPGAVAGQIDAAVAAGRDVAVFTSRQLVTASDAGASLEIGGKVSAALVGIVRRLRVAPRHLVAKGGITSSDIATQGLGVRRAEVRGQILPGVPVWELGAGARFPALPYIVFPGNVGGPEALADAVEILSQPSNT